MYENILPTLIVKKNEFINQIKNEIQSYAHEMRERKKCEGQRELELLYRLGQGNSWLQHFGEQLAVTIKILCLYTF